MDQPATSKGQKFPFVVVNLGYQYTLVHTSEELHGKRATTFQLQKTIPYTAKQERMMISLTLQQRRKSV